MWIEIHAGSEDAAGGYRRFLRERCGLKLHKKADTEMSASVVSYVRDVD